MCIYKYLKVVMIRLTSRLFFCVNRRRKMVPIEPRIYVLFLASLDSYFFELQVK